MTTWFHQIKTDCLSTELLDVRVQSGDESLQFVGQGFLKWTASKGVEISLLTDGGKALSKNRFGHMSGLEIGSLIPQSAFLSLAAKTHDGHSVRIERLFFDGYSARNDHETVVWNIDQSGLRSAIDFFARCTAHDRVDAITFLLSNAGDLVWPKKHSITQLGGLEVTTAFGEVTAMELRNGDVLVSIKTAEPQDLSKLLDAVGFAFAFWAGKVMPLIAFQAHLGESTWCRLFPARRFETRAETPPLSRVPLPTYLACHEPLLQRALEFFFNDGRGVIGPLIHTRLSCTGSTFSVGILVLCATLEGLAKEVARTTAIAPEFPGEIKNKVAECFKQSGLPEEMVERFLGFASRANEPTPANAITSWCRSSFLGFDAKDKKAWSFRNKSAHGDFNLYGIKYEDRNTSVNRRDRLGNMFNKLVLHAIGYEGKFLDYSNHQERDFPPRTTDSNTEHTLVEPAE